jgi:hypothetical protein
MTKLASTLGFALIVLGWAATIGADVTHPSRRPFSGGLREPAAGSSAATPQLPSTASCVVPQTPASKTISSRSRPADRPGPLPAAQVTRNDGGNVTFEIRQRDDRSVDVNGRSGDLQISKSVTSDGALFLDLRTGSDHVSIGVSGQGTTVTRNGATIEWPRGSSDARPQEARRLLAGSEALLQFRRIGASLIDAEDRSVPGVAMLIADAAVGQLTGDVGAVGRAARFLGHARDGNRRPAALLPECFQTMDSDMVFALNDYAACLGSVWGNVFWEDLCAWRWVVEVESVWFQFIGCSGLGGMF